METTADKIRNYLKRHRIRQRDVAAYLGIGQGALNQKLRSCTPLSVEEYRRICDYLSLPYGTFMGKQRLDKEEHMVPLPQGRRPGTPVSCVETGKIYPSFTVASEETGIATFQLTKSIETGEPAGGFHWEFA